MPSSDQKGKNYSNRLIKNQCNCFWSYILTRDVWYDSQPHITSANTIGSFKRADICVDRESQQ